MPQCVVQGQEDALYVRLLHPITEAPITLSGTHTITIYNPSNSEVVAATSSGVTASGHTATYTRTWTEATFPRSYQTTLDARSAQRQFYRARWSLNTGAYLRDTYFEVIRRRFLPQLTDADFTARHPYLSAQLPSGQTTFAAYRQRTWDRISLLITQRTGRNPGDLYLPETFSLCHEYWTLADFYLNNSFDGAAISEDTYKAERFEKMGANYFDAAMSRQLVDTDDDGIVTTGRETFHLNGIRVIR